MCEKGWLSRLEGVGSADCREKILGGMVLLYCLIAIWVEGGREGEAWKRQASGGTRYCCREERRGETSVAVRRQESVEVVGGGRRRREV